MEMASVSGYCKYGGTLKLSWAAALPDVKRNKTAHAVPIPFPLIFNLTINPLTDNYFFNLHFLFKISSSHLRFNRSPVPIIPIFGGVFLQNQRKLLSHWILVD
jgi:hypothetical protein